MRSAKEAGILTRAAIQRVKRVAGAAGLLREAFSKQAARKGAALADIDSKKSDGHSAGLCS